MARINEMLHRERSMDRNDEKILEYVSTRTAFVRQIFCTTKANHIHMVAASTDPRDLKYLTKMIQKKCGDDIEYISCHAVTEGRT